MRIIYFICIINNLKDLHKFEDLHYVTLIFPLYFVKF